MRWLQGLAATLTLGQRRDSEELGKRFHESAGRRHPVAQCRVGKQRLVSVCSRRPALSVSFGAVALVYFYEPTNLPRTFPGRAASGLGGEPNLCCKHLNCDLLQSCRAASGGRPNGQATWDWKLERISSLSARREAKRERGLQSRASYPCHTVPKNR
jgi:hypothetical protein